MRLWRATAAWRGRGGSVAAATPDIVVVNTNGTSWLICVHPLNTMLEL